MTLGAMSAGIVASALPASASAATTATYVIGTASGSVSSVTASVANGTAAGTGLYTIGFTTPAALGNGATDTVTFADSDGNAIVNTAGTVAVQYTGANGGTQLLSLAATNGQITIPATADIPAGASVTLSFNATNPGAGSYTFSVSTQADSTSVNSNAVTITAGAAPFGVTVHNPAPGATSEYDFDNYPTSSSVATAYSITLTAANSSVTWPAAGYTVDQVSSSGTMTPITVSSVTPTTTNGVTLALASGVPAGDSVDVTVQGVGNPSAASAVTSEVLTETVGSNTAQTATAQYGNSVTTVAASASPATAGTAATYTVSFKPTTTTSATPTITVALPAGATAPTAGSTALVTDTTSGMQYLTNNYTYTAATTTAPATVAVSPTFALTAGDSVTVLLSNITNPPAGTYNTLTVKTTSDQLPAAASAFTIGAANAPGSATITVSPNTPGYPATYTIGNFQASASGTSFTTVSLTAPSGTIFPSVPGDYTLTDATTPAGNTSFSATGGNAVVSGGGDTVTLTVPTGDTSVAAGDNLTLTATGVVNPSNGSYTIAIGGNTQAAAATPSTTFPHADNVFPNGAMINYNGTFYVFAGGKAFGIPTPAAAEAIMAVDPAKVITATSGETVPTSAPQAGTLIKTYNSPAFYVVGTDGQLHPFASPSQFLADGYDATVVNVVPSLGGLTVGSAAGTTQNAIATMSNGAIVNSGGTFYEFAGGKAFGIPTPARLAAVLSDDTAVPIDGTVTTAMTNATVSNGTVLQVVGNPGIYVVNGGKLFAFASQSQYTNDGFGGGPILELPNLGGMTPATGVTGS